MCKNQFVSVVNLMTNFSFLQSKPEYALFAPACVEAEKIYATAPAMCAVGLSLIHIYRYRQFLVLGC